MDGFQSNTTARETEGRTAGRQLTVSQKVFYVRIAAAQRVASDSLLSRLSGPDRRGNAVVDSELIDMKNFSASGQLVLSKKGESSCDSGST